MKKLNNLEVSDKITLLDEKSTTVEEKAEIKTPQLHKVVKNENLSSDKNTIAKYVYRDEDGKEVFTVHKRIGRGSPYLVSHKAENGEEIFGLSEDSDLPIYNLPNVRQAISKEEVIWITEGESKADTLNKLGVTATTVAFKDTDKWHDYYNKYLVGAKSIVVLVDNDTKSEEFADNTGQTLLSTLEDVNIRCLYMREIYSSLKEGGDIDDLVELAGIDTVKATLESIESQF